MLLFKIFLVLHILAGFLALCIFWIPIVTKKGGKLHNRIGWIYVAAMSAVSLSALYLAVYRIFFDVTSDANRVAFSWFLIFIAILSSATAWYGLRVLRFKNRKQAHRNPVDLLFPALLTLSGIAISAYGFVISFPLLKWFPIIINRPVKHFQAKIRSG
ncbi:DUF2306 domain-containing protein [Effusibacillus dendaii]|uniref:DUF2306 domain-containing protein n=1 Tax=Effusibacillus dendaii TaxID=2743772 RepID=A0A7I8DF50_9BACL|nr:DUF2306 domain-containing protein [Effusibacillus dendaii]BCJ87579.1 hypothetical protein skT53_25640 [Effusibacillus dendaii]